MKKVNLKLLLLLLFSIISLNINILAFEAVNSDGKTIYYNVTSETDLTVEVTNGSTYSGNINIPSSVSYNGEIYSVTSIGNRAFFYCSGLTSITIPNSVTSIGKDAFFGCSGLTSITIPNSVTSIGVSAFSNCSGLTSITIPNSVTSIGEGAFYYCTGLTSITIGNSVTEIGDYAFSDCSELKEINIALENSNYSSIDGVLFNKDKTELIIYPKGKQGEYAIPNSVTTIGENAFRSCSGLTSITIPNSVPTIGSDAFYNCTGLTSISIPNSVTSIGNRAFFYCSGLTSITIPNSVTSIGVSAFYNCSGLTSITIGNSVTTIGDYTFYNCSGLSSITIPNNVTKIGNHAFNYCSALKSLILGENLDIISAFAFADCSSLSSIFSLNSTPPVCDEDTFYATEATIKVYVPIGTVPTYKAANIWKNFSYIEESDFVGIEDVEIDANKDKANAYISGGVLILTDIDMPTNVAVYNMSGTNVANVMITSDNCSIDLSNLPKGIYIVVTDNNKQKVVL